MGTHSHVGIRRCNGKIHYIYIHSDGYPSGAGATLVCKYNTLARVEKLIAAGSQVCVDEDPVQNDDESFATADDDEAYRNTGRWIEYYYLFDEKEERWEIATLNRFIPLLNPMQLSKEEWNRAIDVQWGLAEPEDASGSGSGETISGSP